MISGVGHETDFTIADFVADVRAPTPSAAAELVSPSRDDYRMTLDAHSARLSEMTWERLNTLRARLDASLRALGHLSPQARVAHDRQRLADLSESFAAALGHRLALWRERLAGATARLAALSPLAVLDRGYAVVRQEKTGTIVRSVKQVKAGDKLNVRVSDGEFGARSE